MNNYSSSAADKQPYSAPVCETHSICPEGIILSGSGWENGGAGNYNDWSNDLGNF